MKTEFQYIKMVKIANKPKTTVWEVQNKRGDYSLGIIKWNPGWRQYCYFPDDKLVFSVGCLQDICLFITELRSKQNGEPE
jgi:hypothetical protein